MGPRVGLDVCGKSCYRQVSTPKRLARNESVYRPKVCDRLFHFAIVCNLMSQKNLKLKKIRSVTYFCK